MSGYERVSERATGPKGAAARASPCNSFRRQTLFGVSCVGQSKCWSIEDFFWEGAINRARLTSFARLALIRAHCSLSLRTLLPRGPLPPFVLMDKEAREAQAADPVGHKPTSHASASSKVPLSLSPVLRSEMKAAQKREEKEKPKQDAEKRKLNAADSIASSNVPCAHRPKPTASAATASAVKL